jgi:hypothetical protein
MKMEQSVPKRQHIKFRRRGITQKKAYNTNRIIQNYTQGTRRNTGAQTHNPFEASLDDETDYAA